MVYIDEWYDTQLNILNITSAITVPRSLLYVILWYLWWLIYLGRYEEAKALLSQALFAFKTCHSEIKEECLTDLNIESLSIALRKDMMFHRLPDSQKILASILTEHSDIDALTSDLLNNLAACNEVLGKYTSCQNQYLFPMWNKIYHHDQFYHNHHYAPIRQPRRGISTIWWKLEAKEGKKCIHVLHVDNIYTSPSSPSPSSTPSSSHDVNAWI